MAAHCWYRPVYPCISYLGHYTIVVVAAAVGMIQRKELLHARKSSGDGPQSTDRCADLSDDPTPNSSSIPPSSAVTGHAAFTAPALNANGRTLVHRCGLANGKPVQME